VISGIDLLSPNYLWGLCSLILPFLLLLTKARAFQTINFSSVRFLTTMMKKASNIIEWKRLILLSVRLMMLMAMALAFSLPFLTTSKGFFAWGRGKTAVFLLDASYGMGYTEQGRSLFEIGKEKISKIAASKPEYSQRSLYVFHEKVVPICESEKSPEGFLRAVKNVSVSQRSGGVFCLKDFFKKNEKILSGPDVQIFLLSDFSTEKNKEDDVKAMLRCLQSDFPLKIIELRPSSVVNLTLERILLPARPLLTGKMENLRVFYHAQGFKAGEKTVLTMSSERGDPVQRKVTFDASGRGYVDFEHVFPVSGSYAMTFSSAPDALLPDNSIFLILPVRSPVRVLLLENEEPQYPFESPYFYFARALQSVSGETAPWIEVDKGTFHDLQNLGLSGHDMVVLADFGRFESKWFAPLWDYVRKGGNLLIAPGGRHPETLTIQNDYFSRLIQGLPGPVLEREGGSMRFEPLSYDVPFLGLFDQGNKGNLSRVRFKKIMSFIPAAQSKRNTHLWINLEWPVFWDTPIEKGKIWIWASSLDSTWNDFSKYPAYVPFFVEWLKYASTRNAAPEEKCVPGDVFKLTLKSGDFPKKAYAKGPLGETLTLYPDPASRAFASFSFQLEKAGFYEWVYGEESSYERGRFSCNVEPAEADLNYPDLKGIETAVEGSVRGSGEGRQPRQDFLYWPLWYFVLAMLLAEVWLSNHGQKPDWI
jgi:hypothetical protein